jgi:hypothetical protein
VAEASGSRPATLTVESRKAAAEARQEPAVTGAQLAEEAQPAVPIVVALPVSSAMEAEVAAPQQEPALVGSSQATAVEIPDDDTLPPGWDQWGSLPAPAPEPQVGALVRRWDGRMVAGARGTASRPLRPTPPPGSSGPAADPGQEQERVDAPSPLFVDAQEE